MLDGLSHNKVQCFSKLHLVFLEQSIAELEMDMEYYFAPYDEELNLLKTIPGVGSSVSKVIIAEIGNDMSVFPF